MQTCKSSREIFIFDLNNFQEILKSTFNFKTKKKWLNTFKINKNKKINNINNNRRNLKENRANHSEN